MDKLLDELLALRGGSRPGVGQEENVDLVELVHDVVWDARFEADARSSSVAFDRDVAALGATAIMGNHGAAPALENVVRNAARHTPSGTRVHVAGTIIPRGARSSLRSPTRAPGFGHRTRSIFEPSTEAASLRGRRPRTGLRLRAGSSKHTVAASARPTG